MPATHISVSDAASTMRAVSARALASALVLGIDQCAEEGRPLTQVQQVHLATMSVMAYEDILDGCSTLDLDIATIRSLVSDSGL